MRVRPGFPSCRRLILVILWSLLLPAAAWAGPETGVRETVLANGLTVLTRELHVAPVVTVWTWYRVGSRNEAPGLTGISHQVEHMMFKGTERLRPGDIDRLVQQAGGRQNAFTSYDFTAYHITLPSQQVETALRIEADRMLNCRMDPQELAREKGVVLSELLGRRNNPEALLQDAVHAAAFRLHPYRFPIIGLQADVEAFTPQAVAEYYRRYYHPNNALLVIVGDFQTEALLALVQKHFGNLPAGPLPAPAIPPEPPQAGERRVVLRGPGATALLEVLYHVPAAGHPDLYPLAVLDAILTAGDSSRLHRALVESDLAVSESSYLSRRLDPGWIEFSAAIRNGVPRESVEQAFGEAIQRVRSHAVTAFELEKAVNQVRASLTFAQGSVSGLARMLGSLELTVGHRELETYLDRIRQVTAADVLRVAREYLAPENRTLGWYVPRGSAGAGPPSPAGHGEVNHHRDALPALGAAAPQEEGAEPGSGPAGRVVRTVLPNGLTLIAAENPVAPSLAVKGYVLAGPVLDPSHQAGLSNLTAALLSRGTAAHSAAALAERLDFLGAQLDIRAERETVGITARMLSDHLGTVLDLLAECLRSPAFPEAELARAVRQIQTGLEREAESPRSRATAELFAALYPPGHPLHRNPQGLVADLDGIRRADVARFHERFYRPERTVLVVAGALSPERVLTAVERAFGGWPRGVEPQAPHPPLPAVASATRRTVTLPGTAEAIVMLGGNGIRRDSPDYYAAFLANWILGGDGMATRLMRALREQGGMTYGVYSYFYPVLGERPWVISLQTAPATVDRAVAGVLAEADRLRQAGVSAGELALAQASAIGTLALSLEDQMGQAFVLRDTELFHLGLDFPQRFPDLIRGVRLDQVQAAARQYLHPDRLVQIVVTRP